VFLAGAVQIKNLTWLFVALVIGAFLLEANAGDTYSLKYPHRLLNGFTVDLSPLFSWWRNAVEIEDRKLHERQTKTNLEAQLPPRPLSAWVKISGRCANDAGLGWICMAKIEDRPGHLQQGVIFLRHPPRDERAKFENLTTASTNLLKLREQAHMVSDAEGDRAIERND